MSSSRVELKACDTSVPADVAPLRSANRSTATAGSTRRRSAAGESSHTRTRLGPSRQPHRRRSRSATSETSRWPSRNGRPARSSSMVRWRSSPNSSAHASTGCGSQTEQPPRRRPSTWCSTSWVMLDRTPGIYQMLVGGNTRQTAMPLSAIWTIGMSMARSLMIERRVSVPPAAAATLNGGARNTRGTSLQSTSEPYTRPPEQAAAGCRHRAHRLGSPIVGEALRCTQS